ncbi:unnamed protein product [Peronospora farinosa]|uniref:Importin N-terminal domain-containing protein n=1 Tax=Peronospora farinosa TaxID=134698 RepID=A0AAV0T9D2_9STRA|nr:unnamed protein product [Peronospora farinosa]
MMEQLTACARQLFEGVPGSHEQHAANAWLMQFQTREEAWQAALQVLEHSVCDSNTHQLLAAPQLVAMQILRLKTQHEWTHLSVQQQQIVRQTLLKLLEITCGTENGLSRVSCRIACVTLADIVVKSCRSWTNWKSDVLRLVNGNAAARVHPKGSVVLVDVLGAIPLQILASESAWTMEEMQQMLSMFQVEGHTIMTAVQMILTSIPDERNSAFRCLESWIVGCIPTHETFGLNAAHLFASGLLDELFDAAISDGEDQAQLAAGIIADSFVWNALTVGSESICQAVLHSGYRLIEAMPLFQSEWRPLTGTIMTKERRTSACRGMSRIACSLAMNHAPVLFSNHDAKTKASRKSLTLEQQQRFSFDFLELLLACSSYDDIDVAQPTLEIWFFFLENNPLQNEMSWQLFDTTGQEHVVNVLSRLVNALIEQCKYPQWFVERNQIVSDDPEIEAIAEFRREIADTMLSLFSKWPRNHGKPAGDYASCVKSMCQMLSDCKDVALIDALLFLLSYTVELFDTMLSDSESADDLNSFQAPVSSGIDVLLGVFDCVLNLPMHPLVINGVARYLRLLSASFAVPPSIRLRASMVMCQGLQCASSFPVAIQSLLQSSSYIVKYTTMEERAPLFHALLQLCTTSQTKTSEESKGDLLEATFRISCGLSDADFGVLCSSVLSNLTVRVQSANSIEASSSVYMLGRALGGVQDQQHGFALIEQLWPLAKASLLQHRSDGACRRIGAGFFLSVISHLEQEALHPIEAEILEMCLWWYGEGIAPDILTCCTRIILRQRGNLGMQSSAGHAFERLLADFRSKLHDVTETKTDCGKLSMESFLSQNLEADKMIPEVQQFLEFAREVLSSFPQALLQNRSNGEPTLYWVCLDLATRLVKVDHQMQEICDAACNFLLHAMRCQPEQIVEKINIFATEVVRVVMSYLGPKRRHYSARNLWDFLFQCLHAPQISTQIRGRYFACVVLLRTDIVYHGCLFPGGFLSAVSTVVNEEGALRSLLSADVCQQIPGEMRMRCQRHRFRLYFTRLAHLAEVAYS